MLSDTSGQGSPQVSPANLGPADTQRCAMSTLLRAAAVTCTNGYMLQYTKCRGDGLVGPPVPDMGGLS